MVWYWIASLDKSVHLDAEAPQDPGQASQVVDVPGWRALALFSGVWLLVLPRAGRRVHEQLERPHDDGTAPGEAAAAD
jgi:hypothetical protein